MEDETDACLSIRVRTLVPVGMTRWICLEEDTRLILTYIFGRFAEIVIATERLRFENKTNAVEVAAPWQSEGLDAAVWRIVSGEAGRGFCRGQGGGRALTCQAMNICEWIW